MIWGVLFWGCMSAGACLAFYGVIGDLRRKFTP